jgi:hypothetical protein
MKYHVQFLEQSIVDNGLLVEALGSDGVFILDGRNTLETMKEDAMDRLRALRKVRKFVGFVIKEGNRFDRAACIFTETDIAIYTEKDKL